MSRKAGNIYKATIRRKRDGKVVTSRKVRAETTTQAEIKVNSSIDNRSLTIAKIEKISDRSLGEEISDRLKG